MWLNFLLLSMLFIFKNNGYLLQCQNGGTVYVEKEVSALHSCLCNGNHIVFKPAYVKCKCPENIDDSKCQFKTCVYRGNRVFRNCICNNSSTTDRSNHQQRMFCKCKPNFSGDRCQYKVCYRGSLIIGNKCICDKNWYGERCDQKSVCRIGYTGINCDVKARNCNHGQVIDESCHCLGNWTGKFCDQIQCFFGRRISKDHCICYGGYAPPTCQFQTRLKPNRFLYYIWTIGVFVTIALCGYCCSNRCNGWPAMSTYGVRRCRSTNERLFSVATPSDIEAPPPFEQIEDMESLNFRQAPPYESVNSVDSPPSYEQAIEHNRSENAKLS